MENKCIFSIKSILIEVLSGEGLQHVRFISLRARDSLSTFVPMRFVRGLKVRENPKVLHCLQNTHTHTHTVTIAYKAEGCVLAFDVLCISIKGFFFPPEKI